MTQTTTSDTETQTDPQPDHENTARIDSSTILNMFKSMMEDVQEMITENQISF